MKKLIILIIVLLGCTNLSFSQIDSCLIEPIDGMPEDYTYYQEWQYFGYNFNLDSILLDTCNSNPNNWIYFTKNYTVVFEVNIFPRDTIIDEFEKDSVFTINDLPQKYSHFYSSLDSIRVLFGGHYFVDDGLSSPDTLQGHLRILRLTFLKNHQIDSVVSKIEKLSIVNTIYENGELVSLAGTVYQNNPNLIEVFPNPSTEIIKLVSDELIQSINIINIDGSEIKQIKEPNIEQIDVSNLPAGTYFIIINNKYIHKFIKE